MVIGRVVIGMAVRTVFEVAVARPADKATIPKIVGFDSLGAEGAMRLSNFFGLIDHVTAGRNI